MPKILRPFRVAVALAAIVAFTLSAGLTACTSETSAPELPDEEDDRPVVLTTFTVLADIAQNVAGEHLRVESITKVGAEIHSYEPSPGDLRRASHAELILDNGLGLEAWFEQFVADLDAPHVVVTEGIEPMPIAEGADAGHPNPHAWMSPTNVMIYAQNMSDAFAELLPEQAADFQANAERYSEQLAALQHTLVTDIQRIPESKRALITCEGAFSYLARDAGLVEQYIWAVNAERQATPQQVIDVIDYVREHDVPAVFCESTVSDASMRQVVQETGAKFGGTLYVDSLSEPDGPVPTYLDLIAHNIDTILSALSEDGS